MKRALLIFPAIVLLAGCSAAAKTLPAVTTTNTVTAMATVTATVTARPVQVVATKNVTHTVTFTPAPVVAFSDGIFQIPQDVKPGTYKTSGSGDSCYYARLSGLDPVQDIITNSNSDGPMVVTISPSDKAFDTSGGCDWVRVG
jgi:hypothetical protein